MSSFARVGLTVPMVIYAISSQVCAQEIWNSPRVAICSDRSQIPRLLLLRASPFSVHNGDKLFGDVCVRRAEVRYAS